MSRTCEPRRHLTVEEYGLYVYVIRVSFHSGVLYADARSIAEQFSGTRKGVIYRLLAQLTKKGWLQIEKPAKRQASGLFSATEYKPVSHADWIKTHPGRCPTEPVRKSGLDQAPSSRDQSAIKPTHLSGDPDITCPEIENDLSGNPDIVLNKNSLNKSLTDPEREGASKLLAPQAGEISDELIFDDPNFQAFAGKMRFEPQRDLTAERNRQIKLLQARQRQVKHNS
jgi:hypothetical protein